MVVNEQPDFTTQATVHMCPACPVLFMRYLNNMQAIRHVGQRGSSMLGQVPARLSLFSPGIFHVAQPSC